MCVYHILRTLCLVALAVVCSLGTSVGYAQNYRITVDTSNLNGLGTFYLEFQLTDGSALSGDANSQAVVSNFAFTGGALGDVLPPTIGNATGSLDSILTLTDGPTTFGPLADFAQGISVSSNVSKITFDLNLMSSAVDTPTPDGFGLLVLDGLLNPIPTNGPTGAELVQADFTSQSPVPTGYSSSSPNLTARVKIAQIAASEPGSLDCIGMFVLVTGMLAASRLAIKARR